MTETPNPIRCMAVDDEPLQLELISEYIQKIDSLKLVQTFTNAHEAIRAVKEDPVDLLFLDIQMPELTGVQVMEILKGKVRFILTTAYTEYALKSYDYEVIDYLVKPISFERLYKAVEKAKPLFSMPEISGKPARGYEESYLFIKTGSRIVKLDLEDILYIEGLKDYVQIYTTSKPVITLESMAAIEKKLQHRSFVRLHKSYIVALSKISYIEKGYVVVNETPIPIGNTYRESFFKNIDTARLGRNL